MTDQSDLPSGDIFKTDAKAAAVRWLATGAALTGLGYLATFCVLFTYLHSIGYPKLLGPAMGNTSALLPWIIIAGIILALCLAGLMVTSGFYAAALAFFNRNPNVQPYMARMLMLPALAGITAMVASILIGQRTGPFTAMSISATAVTLAMLLTLLVKDFRKAVQDAATPEDSSTPLRISLIVTGHFANNVTGFSTRLRGV